jgi:hypothetical protein
VKNPSTNTAQPQFSTNYQFDTVYQSHPIAVDADVYRIDLTNLLDNRATMSIKTASTIDLCTYTFLAVQNAQLTLIAKFEI